MKVMKRWAGVLGICMTVLMPPAHAVGGEAADYVFKNGAIYTMDGKNPQVQAIAITGKHISYVGGNDGVGAYLGDKTQVTDLRGQMLLPGFVESHIHPTLAIIASGADLPCDSVAEVLARTKAWAEAHPDAKLNVTMQSSAQWAMPDPTIQRTAGIVGEDVAFRELFRHNSVLKAGGRVAFGTDWPASGYIVTYRPLDTLQVAITRGILRKYGKDQFTPVLPPAGERLTLDQALKASTLDAAYVLGLEDRIGSLQPGKLADIVILEKDLHKIAPSEISTTKVKLTMMNGRITHRDGI